MSTRIRPCGCSISQARIGTATHLPPATRPQLAERLLADELALADTGDAGLDGVHSHRHRESQRARFVHRAPRRLGSQRCEARAGSGARRGGRGRRGRCATVAIEPLTRIGKAAKDFLTEVDLASEAALKRSLAASTPEIGFYGEEGGGAALRPRARVGRRPARRHDQLRDRLAAVRRDGRPARGRRAGAGRDRPAVPGRAGGLSGAGRRRRVASTRGSSPSATRSTAAGRAWTRSWTSAAEIHRRALRFRCVGAASVLWTWLAGGQIQGMFLAHNNPYDVVAGHAIARAVGRGRHRLRGRAADAGLDRRDGRRAGHPRRRSSRSRRTSPPPST